MENRGHTLRRQILRTMLDEAKGTIEGPYPFQVLNAATLGDLLILGRACMKSDLVFVRDSASTNDAVLDASLRILAATDPPRSLKNWVSSLHEEIPVPADVRLARLVMRGLLSLEEAVQMGLAPMGTRPAQALALVREMEADVRAALHATGAVDERTCILICLLVAGKLMPRLLGMAEAGSARARAAALTERSVLATVLTEVIGQATDLPSALKKAEGSRRSKALPSRTVEAL